MNSTLILHYHEIWLKGGNKKYYLSRLITAIKQSLEDLSVAGPQYVSERLILRPRQEAELPQVIERLRRVFGLAYIALGREVPRDLEGLGNAACELMAAKDNIFICPETDLAFEIPRQALLEGVARVPGWHPAGDYFRRRPQGPAPWLKP